MATMADPDRKAPRPDAPSQPPPSDDPLAHHQTAEGRRDFLAKTSRAAMAAGLVGGYGALGAVGIRYLYPARPDELSWQYVRDIARIEVGSALRYRGPAGETINIARQGNTGTAEDFVALSSTCPHLGCQVRWEGQNNRFFCPCHNGVFDPTGVATEGPPAEAGQRLAAYPLKVEGGLLQIAVPTARLASGEEARGEVLAVDDAPSGPGHDPCLAPPPRAEGKRSV
jgi:nitrite reductase/ring-hydroxylating ferredoxin subunit